jgi:hypothetical protein
MDTKMADAFEQTKEVNLLGAINFKNWFSLITTTHWSLPDLTAPLKTALLKYTMTNLA